MIKSDRTRGRGIMATITDIVTGSPTDEIAREIDAARDRRDALTSRLAASEQLLLSKRAEATKLALDGRPDAELDQAEAASRELVDRIGSLTAALAQAGEQLAQLEARAEAEEAALKRQQVADATETLAVELEAAREPLAQALRSMGLLLFRASPIAYQAGRAAMYCRAVDTELAVAGETIVDALHHHASEVRRGYREAVGPHGDQHAEVQTGN